ncbi:MAG: hypothetical protein Q9160_003032 [Pyrenula sp. 1 TL-2023]
MSNPPKTSSRPRKRRILVPKAIANNQTPAATLTSIPLSIRRPSDQIHVPDSAQEECFVVGIDFGATFSALAYTRVNHKAFLEKRLDPIPSNQYKTLNKFDHSPDTSATVSSSLLYNEGTPGNGPVKWGYGTDYQRIPHPKNHWKVSCPKMLLSSQPKHKAFVRSMKRIGRKVQRDGIEMVTDFLKALKAKFESEIRSQNKHFIDMPRYYYCGYPPGWKPEETAKLSLACLKAGLDDIRMVSEPEAAANALLADDSFNRQNLERGDGILVVDAGGMTVDTIVYEIVQTRPSFATREVMVGDSANCGSAFINTRCREAIRKCIHSMRYPKKVQEILAEYGADKFEDFKKSSLKEDSGDRIELFKIDYPYGMLREIIPSKEKWFKFDIEFPYNQITEDFMEPSLRGTVQLTKRAIHNAAQNQITIKRIFLTGGFSASTYLCKRLQKSIFEAHNIELFKPNIPEAAVAQGIVTIALSQSAVRSSVSRLSIGLDEEQLFDPALHGSQIAVREDAIDKQHYVPSISWIIRRGDKMKESRVWVVERRRTFTKRDVHTWNPRRPWWKFDEEIIETKYPAKDSCCRISRSSKVDSGQMLNDKVYNLAKGYSRLGWVSVDLSKIPGRTPQSLLSSSEGENFMELNFKYEVKWGGSELTFKFVSADSTATLLLDPFHLEEDIAQRSTTYTQTSDSEDVDSSQENSNPSSPVSPLFYSPLSSLFEDSLSESQSEPRSEGYLCAYDRAKSETVDAEMASPLPTRHSANIPRQPEKRFQTPQSDIYEPPDSPLLQALTSSNALRRKPATPLKCFQCKDTGGPGPGTLANRSRRISRSSTERSETLPPPSVQEAVSNVRTPTAHPRPTGLRLGGFGVNHGPALDSHVSVKHTGEQSRSSGGTGQANSPRRIVRAAKPQNRRHAHPSPSLSPSNVNSSKETETYCTPPRQVALPITPGKTFLRSAERSPRVPAIPRLNSPPHPLPHHPSPVTPSPHTSRNTAHRSISPIRDLISVSSTCSAGSSPTLASQSQLPSQSLSQNTALNEELVDLELPPRSDVAVRLGEKRKRSVAPGGYAIPEMPPGWGGVNRKKRRKMGLEEDEEDEDWEPDE